MLLYIVIILILILVLLWWFLIRGPDYSGQYNVGTRSIQVVKIKGNVYNINGIPFTVVDGVALAPDSNNPNSPNFGFKFVFGDKTLTLHKRGETIVFNKI